LSTTPDTLTGDQETETTITSGTGMRDQYAGDVSDVLKFAFLRALAGADRTLGIAWYYVQNHDGRLDGQHLEWREEPAWQRLDRQLYVGLSALPERSVAALEHAAIWPNGTLFHREPMPSPLQRNAWGEHKRTALDGANIVFLDPDNGLGAETAKHATLSEIKLLRRTGRAIVFITFPGRNKPHDVLVQHLHEQLRDEAQANAITLRTSVSVPRTTGSLAFVPRLRWFTVVDPDAALVARANEFASKLKELPRVSAQLDGAECARERCGI
jgi:hypothetical protein